jgi:hypothetical protein
MVPRVDEQRRAQVFFRPAIEQLADDGARNRRDDERPEEPHVHVFALPQEAGLDEPDPIAPEDGEDRRERAPMQRHVEGEPRILPVQHPGQERQVRARGDGQELGEPLYDAVDDGLVEGQRLRCLRASC